tara:strand:+ start:413 stop:622 length:210 start_codon:yes stop_codon:yes gene_type:complete
LITKKPKVYKQLPENTPSPTQAEWDLIVEKSKSAPKRKTYKEIGHVLEVVAVIALLIFMAGYVEPRFNF